MRFDARGRPILSRDGLVFLYLSQKRKEQIKKYGYSTAFIEGVTVQSEE